MTQLALFDLDHTLLTCDSDVQWSAFLSEEGFLNQDDAVKRQQFYDDYEAGCLNIDAFLQFQLAPLARFSREELNEMHQRFMKRHILPHITQSAKQLVQNHTDRGDDVVLISATNEFIITPIAQIFGIQNVIGVRLEIAENQQYTGRYLGTPSFREGKVIRLNEWLAENGKTLQSYERSYFYTDSFNDLPLLELVDVPVTINPDETLAKTARKKGWKILDLSDERN